ncbi:MAG: tetratricopeptide repeat protein [Rhodanobacteraceae bacterium]
MTDLWRRLKQRKLVQWALAYLAGAWALLQVLDLAAGSYHWPDLVMHVAFGVLALGLVITLLLAWYHGERGAQKVTGVELLLLAGVFAIGGFLIWHYAGSGSPPTSAGHAHVLAVATSTAVPKPAPATSIPAKSIAVLPFENLSSDKNNAYFADGMQDLILTKLADIGDLKVISRTSTLQYGSHPQNLKKIGKELGVATLLEGSVQKAGDQVLVNVQLIDARSDAHLWANSYQRKLENVFGVEGEVAEKIASALNAKLSPEESRRLSSGLSEDPAANLLYLRARHEIDAMGSTNPINRLIRAIDLYRQAVSRVPGFALARAGLSHAESLLASYGGGGKDAGKLSADARAQAEQALKLAPSLPESHLAMGYVEYYGKDDYGAALDAFAAALHLRPNDAAVYAARGYALNRQGKFSQAIEALQKAWSLDPNARVIPFNLGSIYMAQGNYDEAATIFRNAIALQPDNADVRYGYASCIMLSTGNVERSIAEMKGPGDLPGLGRSIFLADHREYDQAIALVKTLPDSLMSYYPGGKDMELAGLYQSAGDMPRARTYASSALPGLRALLQGQGGHPGQASRTLSAMATAQLILGKTRDAMTSIKAMLAAAEASRDLSERPFTVLTAAQGYAMAGRAARAVSLLSRALTMPGIGRYYSPVMLWIDPSLDPIRKTPAFQALLKKYADSKPAVVPKEARSD